MNTPFTVSDDQNTITHESGLVTEFSTDSTMCHECIYNHSNVDCFRVDMPCTGFNRNDFLEGVFIIKESK